ncbi:uncharacterized protein LOC108735803 [Agrilus planipennis]|uniref:Uncharacterized protein LOC108735803 n=1 Tax=Agrilus planipennis TaxID=224129 RepID=A0A1W4WTV2_AGRPL|nr:uncharacterized protein LOC108735803 [Agrilus planipennis]
MHSAIVALFCFFAATQAASFSAATLPAAVGSGVSAATLPAVVGSGVSAATLPAEVESGVGAATLPAEVGSGVSASTLPAFVESGVGAATLPVVIGSNDASVSDVEATADGDAVELKLTIRVPIGASGVSGEPSVASVRPSLPVTWFR